MRRSVALLALAALLAAGAAPLAARQGAPKPDNGKILGTWGIEVYADAMTVTLTLLAQETDGVLGIKVSEQYGMFTDAPADNVSFDGTLLKFVLNVPSPPDGLARPWAVEARIGEDVLEGLISSAELMISAGLIGKRIKK